MIEAHDGRVGFDSQVGVGSTFWFEIAAAALVDRPAHQAA
jgi:signal transduction histidine kinase